MTAPVLSEKVQIVRTLEAYAHLLGDDPDNSAAVHALREAGNCVDRLPGRTPCVLCMDFVPNSARCKRWGEVVPEAARAKGCECWSTEVPF